MLAEIGIIVGLYIMTRMLELERGKDQRPSLFTRVMAAVTFIVTLIVVFDLLIRGTTATLTGAAY